VLAEYYRPELIKVNDFISFISLVKEKEEKVSNSSSLEDSFVEGKVVVFNVKDGRVINSNLDVTYKFPYPVYVNKVSVPKEIGETVKFDDFPINVENPVLGVNVDFSKVPFIVVETSNGYKVITKSDVEEVKPVKEKPKKAKAKKKKRAKKSAKKRKIKGKSSRKG
jgi:hypothetical protein